METEQNRLRSFAARTAGQTEEAMRRDLAVALDGSDPLLREILEYGLFNGGKRVRPMLAIISSRLCGRDDGDLYRLAAAFEYLHVATLIHDDVIDHASHRRGLPALGARYGMAAAILAGDWLHARSMYLIGQLLGSDGLEIFSRTTTGMVDGEFLQLRASGDSDADEEVYFTVIQRKTASLIGSTCELGALYGGAGPAERQALGRFGFNMGMAFQIVDDLLDYLGDQQATGKAVGNDFVEGKITLPLIHALRHAPAQTRDLLVRLIREERTPDSAFRVREIMIELGSFQAARKRAEELVSEALACLDVFSGSPGKEDLAVLRALAAYILHRDR